MTRYNADSADQYMRSVLIDELTTDEADNALTALTTLTHSFPALFPFDRTFVRPDHDRTAGAEGPAGVRFVVYGESGVDRLVRLPRAALASLKACIDELYSVLGTTTPLAA